MRTIAISINKGGQGKTTITKSLATAAVESGLNVLVLDVDTQQSSVDWRKRRDKQQADRPLPLVLFCGEKDLPDQLERAEKAGCDLVLIDTPPGKSTETMAAVEAAEYTLIPFWNDQDSYAGVATTAVLARRFNKPSVGIFNFVTPGAKSYIDTARNVLDVIGIPMSSAVLHRYDVHRLANIRGLTAQEMEPEGPAAREIEGLWDWFCAFMQMNIPAQLQNGNSAIVHNGAKDE